MPTSPTSLPPSPGPALCTELVLTATCAEVTRATNFLVGALRASGGAVVSRSFDADGGAELEFEFARRACVDVYCMMIAVGLDLDAASHRQITLFCQCTRECIAATGQDPARVILGLREPVVSSLVDSDESLCRLLAGSAVGSFEA